MKSIMILITKDMRDAMVKCLSDKKMTQDSLASLAGVRRQSVQKWISKETKNIRETVWLRIQSTLLPYLSKGIPTIQVDGIRQHNTNGHNIVKHSELDYKKKVISTIAKSDIEANCKVKVIDLINEL